MTSEHDIIPIPGHPGLHARRVIVDAWQAAGSPPINDAGRLYDKQKRAWDDYQAGTGNPADNPDRPDLYPLGHVRFVALDIDPTPDRVRRLKAAGLVRPFSWESWHWAVPNVYLYALVKELPTTNPEPKEEDDMFTDQDRATANKILSALDQQVVPTLVVVRQGVDGTIERVDESILPTLTIMRGVAAGVASDLDALGAHLRELLTDDQRGALAQQLTA